DLGRRGTQGGERRPESEQQDGDQRTNRWTGQRDLLLGALLGEEDARGLDLFGGEHVEDLVLQREEVPEHARQWVRALALEVLEFLEIVLVQQFSGLPIIDLHQNVVFEASLLDERLAVIGASVER